MRCAKPAEPMEMQVGSLTLVDPSNHDGVEIPTVRGILGGCPAH